MYIVTISQSMMNVFVNIFEFITLLSVNIKHYSCTLSAVTDKRAPFGLCRHQSPLPAEAQGLSTWENLLRKVSAGVKFCGRHWGKPLTLSAFVPALTCSVDIHNTPLNL